VAGWRRIGKEAVLGSYEVLEANPVFEVGDEVADQKLQVMRGF
jgi:hypothetical protein